MRLDGKNAVITGGATGIGAAIGRSLAGEGCRVVLCGRREEKLREAVDTWSTEPAPLMHIVDVADRESVSRLFDWVAEQLGDVDILVNSAGINLPHRSLADTLPEEWDEVLAVNVTGTYNCMRAVLPQMSAGGGGLVVNISSTAGLRADTRSGVSYIASKFAMTSLGTAAALEYGKHGVRVTNICPGDVATPLLDRRPKPPSSEQRSMMVQPEDIAEIVRCIATLPPRAHVAEVVIKPTHADFA